MGSVATAMACEGQLASENGTEGGLRVAYFIAYPHSMAGANRSLIQLLQRLPRQVQPLVVVTEAGRVADACRQLGLAVHVATPGAHLSRFGKAALRWSWPRRAQVLATEWAPYTLRLSRWLRSKGCHLLHANEPRAALLGAAAAKLAGIPAVGHMRGRRAFGGAYLRGFELLCDRIITVCDAIQDDLTQSARQRAVTVYNGTDDLNAQALSAHPRLRWLDAQREQGIPIVGCFASVTPFKGYHHLIDSVAQLREQGMRDVCFLALGAIDPNQSAYERWLLERLKRLGIDNLTFCGFQEQPVAFYRRCDLTVLPSVERERLAIDGEVVEVVGNEGFPRTHLEAMCLGLPVVGTQIAGAAELVVHGETGLLVPPGQPRAMASAMGELLTDPERRRAMGAAGRRRVLEQFSAEHCVQRTLSVYREVLAERGFVWRSEPVDRSDAKPGAVRARAT